MLGTVLIITPTEALARELDVMLDGNCRCSAQWSTVGLRHADVLLLDLLGVPPDSWTQLKRWSRRPDRAALVLLDRPQASRELLATLKGAMAAGLLLCLLVAAVRWGEGWTRGTRSVQPVTPFVLNEHGISVGDTLDMMQLACDDNVKRAVAAPGYAQIITFSSPGDCSMCQQHLAGLEQLASSGRLPIEHFYVVFSPSMSRARSARAYRTISEQPVCWDDAGVYWQQHSIAHTPFTVLLLEGRIALMHDAPLLTPSGQQRLLDSVAVYVPFED
jgi:hypothetical protein